MEDDTRAVMDDDVENVPSPAPDTPTNQDDMDTDAQGASIGVQNALPKGVYCTHVCNFLHVLDMTFNVLCRCR